MPNIVDNVGQVCANVEIVEIVRIIRRDMAQLRDEGDRAGTAIWSGSGANDAPPTQTGQ
jgi:hypothetical protein